MLARPNEGRFQGCALAIGLAVLLFAQPAAAQLAPMTPVQRANVRLALDNLAALIRNGHALLPAKPANKADTERKAAAEEQLMKLQEILDNLEGKLKGGNIHPVPGLKAGKPAKYRLDNHKPGMPRAAYCEGDTWILQGGQWIRCPEGDIVVDGEIIDPGQGQAIDPTTQEGWQKKWTLLHVLAHEKMHEIMIAEQIAILKAREWWAAKTDEEKRKLIEGAKQAAATPEKHQQVYEWQKNVLRWQRAVLEAELRRLRAVKPKPDATAIKDVQAKIKWLRAEVRQLERDMASATNHNEFAFAACGLPEKLSKGLVDIYITTAGMHWKIQTVVSKGKPGRVSIAETVWLGELEREKPREGKAVQHLVMPETVFSGLHVQPEPCRFMREALADGRLFVTRDPRAATQRLPLRQRAAAQ